MSTASDFPHSLRLMADLAPEARTVTKLAPKGADFLREVAIYIEDLERQLAELHNRNGCDHDQADLQEMRKTQVD